MKELKNSLAEMFHRLLEENQGTLTFQTIMEKLADRGQALLVLIFVLPFCLPIQIPGLSTPFGIVLGFIGLRIAFGHRIWLPKYLMQKEVSHETLKKIADFIIKVTKKLRFLMGARMVWLVKNPLLHTLHGVTIALLAFFLALPLPIPFTNLLAAFPIIFFGFALLEEDGLLILVAYTLTLIAFLGILAIFWFGKVGIMHLFDQYI